MSLLFDSARFLEQQGRESKVPILVKKRAEGEVTLFVVVLFETIARKQTLFIMPERLEGIVAIVSGATPGMLRLRR